jgi:hypothetical protein
MPTSDESSIFPTLTSKDWYLALLLVMLTTLLGSWHMVAGVSGVFHDDGIYLSTAKALAEGRGYRLINLPETPAQTKYPPLYPALLAIIWKLCPTFPDNLIYLQFITLLCGAATVGLAYLYLVRFGYFSRGVALCAAAITLTSNVYLYFSTLTLSELPFAFLSVVALWALERQDENPWLKPAGQFSLGVLLSLPLLTRTIGVVFIPLGSLALWKRRRPVLWAALGVSILFLPWMFWMLVIPRWASANPVSTYYTNYLSWWFSFGKTGLVHIIASNLIYAATATISTGLNLFRHGLVFPPWISIFMLVLGTITWFFVTKDLLKGRILAMFLGMYLIIILAWPWPPMRFLVPILPFVLAYFLSWTRQALQRMPLFNSQVFAAILLVAVLAINMFFLARITQLSRKENYPLITLSQEAVAWQSYEDIFRWLKGHTRPHDVIASGLDTMIFLYTGRQAVRPFQGRPVSLFYGGNDQALGTCEEVLDYLRHYKARFLVQLPMPLFSEAKPFDAIIEQLLSRFPGLLTRVYVASDSRFKIYEISQPVAGDKTFYWFDSHSLQLTHLSSPCTRH